MNVLPAVAFQQPGWLILLPLCLLAFLSLRRWRQRRRPLSAYAEPALLRWLMPWPVRGGTSAAWLAAICVLAALAAAGPMLTDRSEDLPRRATDVAVILDISPSMTAADPAPERLQRARMELHDLLERLEGDRVALIAFSAHAYRVLPLTHDLSLARVYLDALEPGLTRHQGSNLVQALETASAAVEQSPAGARAIVLVTDGETADADAVRAAAERLAQRRIPVFVLAAGTAMGAPIATARGFLRDSDGKLHVSRAERELLAELALRSGGRYADMRADRSDTEYLAGGIAALESRETSAQRVPGVPLYAWLLAPALLLALLQGRRYRAPLFAIMPAMFALGLVAAPQESYAAPWDERRAWDALQAGDHEQAATRYEQLGGYRGKMGVGAAAWRRADWTAARESFRLAASAASNDDERVVAWFNEANAAARMNHIEAAVTLLDRILEIHPGHTRAARNRALLQGLLDAGGPKSDGNPGIRQDPAASQQITARDAAQDAPDAGGGSSAQGAAVAATGPGGFAPAAGAPAADGSGFAAAQRSADRDTGTALPPVADDPREVLRHRFMVMDARRVLLPETQPW